MSDNVPQFYRMAPGEIEVALERLDLSNAAFCYLTGTNPKTLRRWLMPDDQPNALEPPFWVTSWLTAAALPGVLDHLRRVADANLVRPSHGNP